MGCEILRSRWTGRCDDVRKSAAEDEVARRLWPRGPVAFIVGREVYHESEEQLPVVEAGFVSARRVDVSWYLLYASASSHRYLRLACKLLAVAPSFAAARNGEEGSPLGWQWCWGVPSEAIMSTDSGRL